MALLFQTCNHVNACLFTVMWFEMIKHKQTTKNSVWRRKQKGVWYVCHSKLIATSQFNLSRFCARVKRTIQIYRHWIMEIYNVNESTAGADASVNVSHMYTSYCYLLKQWEMIEWLLLKKMPKVQSRPCSYQ